MSTTKFHTHTNNNNNNKGIPGAGNMIFGVAIRQRAGQSEVRIQSWARYFSLLPNVYSGFGAHSHSCSMDTRYGGWDTELATPSWADITTEWSCTSAPPMRLHGMDSVNFNGRMPPWLSHMTMTQCAIPCARRLGCLLWRRIRVSLCKTGGVKLSTRPETIIFPSIYDLSWSVVSECTYFWNCYPHESSRYSGESQVSLILCGGMLQTAGTYEVWFSL